MDNKDNTLSLITSFHSTVWGERCHSTALPTRSSQLNSLSGEQFGLNTKIYQLFIEPHSVAQAAFKPIISLSPAYGGPALRQARTTRPSSHSVSDPGILNLHSCPGNGQGMAKTVAERARNKYATVNGSHTQSDWRRQWHGFQGSSDSYTPGYLTTHMCFLILTTLCFSNFLLREPTKDQQDCSLPVLQAWRGSFRKCPQKMACGSIFTVTGATTKKNGLLAFQTLIYSETKLAYFDQLIFPKKMLTVLIFDPERAWLWEWQTVRLL